MGRRWGSSLYGSAISTGILRQFYIHQGQSKQNYRYDVSCHVVLKMCGHAPEGKRYNVATDNLFTTIDLVTNTGIKGWDLLALSANMVQDFRLKAQSDYKKQVELTRERYRC